MSWSMWRSGGNRISQRLACLEGCGPRTFLLAIHKVSGTKGNKYSFFSSTFLYLLIFLYYIHEHLPVCIEECLVPTEVRGESDTFWNWSYGWFEPSGECWELKLGPLLEGQVFLSIEHSLQLHPLFLKWQCLCQRWESILSWKDVLMCSKPASKQTNKTANQTRPHERPKQPKLSNKKQNRKRNKTRNKQNQ